MAVGYFTPSHFINYVIVCGVEGRSDAEGWRGRGGGRGGGSGGLSTLFLSRSWQLVGAHYYVCMYTHGVPPYFSFLFLLVFLRGCGLDETTDGVWVCLAGENGGGRKGGVGWGSSLLGLWRPGCPVL